MGRKKIDASADAPPPSSGGGDYRKRAGKVGITVSATKAEHEAIYDAAHAERMSMSAFLLTAGMERAERKKKKVQDFA